MRDELKQSLKENERQRAKDAGFYDGRFRHRVIEDKKKKQSKTECRSKYYD
jgi:hypothetical protein